MGRKKTADPKAIQFRVRPSILRGLNDIKEGLGIPKGYSPEEVIEVIVKLIKNGKLIPWT